MKPLDGRRKLGCLAVSMASVQRRNIRSSNIRHFGKFGIEPVDNRLPIAVKHPQSQAQRPHILGSQRLFLAQAEGFKPLPTSAR